MTEIPVNIYECNEGDCHLIFFVSLENWHKVKRCPNCGSENMTETGSGIVKNIVEG